MTDKMHVLVRSREKRIRGRKGSAFVKEEKKQHPASESAIQQAPAADSQHLVRFLGW
jgi:hypothetical protein